MSVKIKKQSLINELSSQAPVQEQVRVIVESRVKEAQREMIEEFEGHPVTKEIEGGINANNISKTLGGYGNLFSFIGFNRGEAPTDPIRNRLSRPINTKVRRGFFRRGIFKIELDLPDKEEIYENTPIPWATGLSWAEGIEKGISGLGQFLFGKGKGSRSGAGIQRKSSGGVGRKFAPTSYLTEIYNRFFEKLK